MAAATMVGAACGAGDGADTTELGAESDTSSAAAGSASGSGSASGTAPGISAEDLSDGAAGPAANSVIIDAVDGYRSYVQEQIEIMQAETATFADAVRAGDIESAKAAFPISRRSWERIEPIAGLIEDIDEAVDAREDDFDGPEDPNLPPSSTA